MVFTSVALGKSVRVFTNIRLFYMHVRVYLTNPLGETFTYQRSNFEKIDSRVRGPILGLP